MKDSETRDNLAAALPAERIDRALGGALRRWRVFHRVKQAHAAELLGVAQSTVSRWEAGVQGMETAQRARVETLVAARLDCAADRVLAALVSDSPRPVHLVCDRTHRLLACSRSRAAGFGIDVARLFGYSLLRFSPPPMLEQEARLDALGWYDLRVPEPIMFYTGSNRSRIVPIFDSRCRWTRLLLSDGSAARLTETL